MHRNIDRLSTGERAAKRRPALEIAWVFHRGVTPLLLLSSLSQSDLSESSVPSDISRSEKRPETLLALDPGVTTGYAVHRSGEGFLDAGDRSFILADFRNGRRLNRFMDWLVGLVCLAQPTMIAHEAPQSFAGRRAATVQAQMVGIVEMVADVHAAEVLAVIPTHVKKLATGSGRATKPEMRAATMRALADADDGLRLAVLGSSHAIDAYWIARAALAARRAVPRGPLLEEGE